MQIIITKVINRLALIKYIYIIEQCSLKEAKRKADAISDGIEQSIDIPDKYLTQFKTACEFTIESKRYNMEKHQFKPFEQVLVRDSLQGTWYADFYSHYDHNNDRHQCMSSFWEQCIPYNENTAHLVGTSKPYKEPEPKVWKVTCHKNNEVFHFTNDELKHFIENAVVNNKDIQWFTTTYEGNNS